LQEAEIQFTADVDPYFKAVALFSVSQEDKVSPRKFGIDPEEVYLETLSLPSVTIRAGKFKMAMGKHNQLHSHAYPFIDGPLINTQLLGEEGLNEAGVSAALLLPTGWFSEITAQAFENSNDTLFNSPTSNDAGGLVHLKNLWDLSDDLTAELGLSGAMGKNTAEKTSSIYGADFTMKWRPAVGGKYHALIWSTEYLQGDRKGMAQESLGGLATWLQYQFAQRWWIQGRYEHVGFGRSDAATQPLQNKESVLIGFFPSEFSGIRLQYDHLSTEGSNANNAFAIQYNVSIGAHPAHAY
jgi:hypothetical protein